MNMPQGSTEVVERIRQHLAAEPVVLFMKGTPDFPAVRLFRADRGGAAPVGAPFHAVNIFEDLELRDALKSYSNWPTYPQLYVKGELIGGCDIAMQMLRRAANSSSWWTRPGPDAPTRRHQRRHDGSIQRGPVAPGRHPSSPAPARARRRARTVRASLADMAEQVGSALGVVLGRVGHLVIPVDASHRGGARQHGLPQRRHHPG